MFFRISVSYKFPNIQKNISVLGLALIKLQACIFILKKASKQVSSFEYHKIFNSFFHGTPPVAASKKGWKISKNF